MLTDELLPFHIRLTPGQNTKTRDTLLETTNVERAQNARFDREVGSVSMRPQMAYYNATSLGSNPVHSLYRFYTTTNKYLLAGYQGTFKVGTDSNGTFTNLETGLTSDRKHTFVTYKNLCIYSNGFEDIKVTDGTVSWELGACKAAVAVGAGSITRTDISYQVTIDADAYICGAVSNTISSVTSQNIELTNIPLGPAGTTNRKIYRKSSESGGVYKLLTTIADNTTTTYTDNTSSVAAGATIGSVTDDMPKGKYLQLYRERLLVTGNETYPNRIWHSNPFLPHYIQGTTGPDYTDISPDDGDVITGIPIQLGTVCIFKRNNIRKWNIDALDDTTWFVEDPISFQGCPAPRSIAQTAYGVIYCGWDHLYLFDGASSKPIIDEFDVQEDISRGTIQSCVGFWHDNTYLLSYISSEGGVDYQDRVMRYEWLRNAVSIDTIAVSSFAAFKGDDEAGELYYGDSINGYVYLSQNYEQSIILKTKSQLNYNQTYPDTLASGLNDIALGGTESDPTIEIGWATTINNAVGTINTGYSGTAIIDRPDTTGTYTSEVFQINAGALGKIYWNERLNSGDDVVFYTRTGATVAATEGASWSSGLSNPLGSNIASTANIYFQFKIELTAGAITQTPEVFLSNGYVVKFTYTPGASAVNTAIPFVYATGYRNFGLPHADKIYKKIVSIHDGASGVVTIRWETDEGYTGSFTFDLGTYPRRWESFFPPTAYGRRVKFTIEKTDTTSYVQKELMGLWTPRPVII